MQLPPLTAVTSTDKTAGATDRGCYTCVRVTAKLPAVVTMSTPPAQVLLPPQSGNTTPLSNISMNGAPRAGAAVVPGLLNSR